MTNSKAKDLPTFVDKHELAARIGYSHHSFKRFRKNKIWLKGIHYIKLNSRTIRYNLDLCLNWLANQHEPKVHDAYIKEHLKIWQPNSSQQQT